MQEGPSFTTYIDEAFEFSAPRFFDFVNGETNRDVCDVELWFDAAVIYAPSPLMPRIRAGRSYNIARTCDFGKIRGEKKPILADATEINSHRQTETKTNLTNRVTDNKVAKQEGMTGSTSFKQRGRSAEVTRDNCEKASSDDIDTKTCTPKISTASRKGGTYISSKKHQAARKIASNIKNASALKQKSLVSSEARSKLPASVKREINVKNLVGTPNFAQENQAIKRQKLEGGRTRQVLNTQPKTLPHKSKVGLASGSSNPCSSVNKDNAGIDGRKMYVREPVTPFISMAEMMEKFHSRTRELTLPHLTPLQIGAASAVQRPKLKLTRPKEPEFQTAQRFCPCKVKSSAELEVEMMAKTPKFKARPLNKKIMEAPTLPPLSKSTPRPPEFLELHLETMAPANQYAECGSVASTEASRQDNQWKPHLTTPKSPVLQTLLRARPSKAKCSLELEQEDLERAPKFKARPLNKRIFESKGEMGIFCSSKKEITKPQEFRFATSERIPPPAAVDMFDKLSLNSEPRLSNPTPRNTKPNPFNLKTEERGAEKKRKLVLDLMQKQWEDELTKIPKANPYPYSTDFPLIPPKPEPKQCTRPDPFQLESLVRHEVEMRREMEERSRKEREEAEMRIFKAQPILKEDPIPVPHITRKPLTQVQEFNHHVDHRAVERMEFDQKVKEKEMMYKRYREESEASRMMEEEKALKQLRRTLVLHARSLPKFDNPFRPQKLPKEITIARSTKLHVQQRQRRIVNAVSNAATNMR